MDSKRIHMLTGQRFARLVVTAFAGIDAKRNAVWLCRCDCGGEKKCTGRDLKLGGVKTCGCKRTNYKHGMRNTRTYRSWHAMKERCTNPNHDYFHRYGGRGITICDAWVNSFEQFFKDMGERPDNTTLERKDNEAGYSALNCVWAPRSVQGNNMSNNRVIAFNGERKTLAQWARHFGLTYATLMQRLKSRTFAESIAVPFRRHSYGKRKLLVETK